MYLKMYKISIITRREHNNISKASQSRRCSILDTFLDAFSTRVEVIVYYFWQENIETIFAIEKIHILELILQIVANCVIRVLANSLSRNAY